MVVLIARETKPCSSFFLMFPRSFSTTSPVCRLEVLSRELSRAKMGEVKTCARKGCCMDGGLGPPCTGVEDGSGTVIDLEENQWSGPEASRQVRQRRLGGPSFRSGVCSVFYITPKPVSSLQGAALPAALH